MSTPRWLKIENISRRSNDYSQQLVTIKDIVTAVKQEEAEIRKG